ncbi:MAG: hypothetical protein V1858_04440 [Candidatus Gottesmanbacteria bacterium]
MKNIFEQARFFVRKSGKIISTDVLEQKDLWTTILNSQRRHGGFTVVVKGKESTTITGNEEILDYIDDHLQIKEHKRQNP